MPLGLQSTSRQILASEIPKLHAVQNGKSDQGNRRPATELQVDPPPRHGPAPRPTVGDQKPIHLVVAGLGGRSGLKTQLFRRSNFQDGASAGARDIALAGGSIPNLGSGQRAVGSAKRPGIVTVKFGVAREQAIA